MGIYIFRALFEQVHDGEGEIFAQSRKRLCLLRCLQPIAPPSLCVRLRSWGGCHSKNLPYSRTASGRFFSLSHRYAVLGSNLSPPTKKATLLGGFRGGEGEIRTLEPLLTVTRFPIVRARPATRLLRISSAFKYIIYRRLKYHTTKNIICQVVFAKKFKLF